jgi:tRNA 2-thiouridine synthesizing protein A
MATTSYQIAQVVDAKGQACPVPVVMLAKAIRTLASGQILELIATDAGSKKDIPAWAGKTGNTILETVEENGVFTFYIQKA